MARWSKLPFDLLYEIVMRFETIEDLIYFSTVCRTWNHFATTVKHEFLDMKTMPWLLLAENTQDNPDCLRKVFNPVNNKSYQIKLPETSGCRCWGSAYGWIVTYNHDFELHLFNPFTKARKSLPPHSRLPYIWGNHVRSDRIRSDSITKAFVLEAAPDDFIVFVVYLFALKKLAFARPGDESWTSIEQPGPTVQFDEGNDPPDYYHRRLTNSIADVVSCGAELLILYEDASIGCLDISDLNDPRKLIVKDYLPIHPVVLSDPRNLGLKAREYVASPPGILDELSSTLCGLYLVNCGGEIYLVLRDRGDVKDYEDEDQGQDRGKDEFEYGTFGFFVYKLDSDTKRCSQVQSVGGAVLFVGNNSSMSVPAFGVSNSNCIYFTDDAFRYWGIPKTGGGEDMGVFEMENCMLAGIYDGSDMYSKHQTPLWFMPRF